jgi:hypothetical protein
MRKDERLAPLVRQVVEEHPEWLNSEVADEVSRLSGEDVDRKAASRIRNAIGVGFFQQVDRELSSPEQLRTLALLLAVNCVRNTVIEDYHAAGKLSDPEMAAFNREVADKLYTALTILRDPDYAGVRGDFVRLMSFMYPSDWDEPKLDQGIMRGLEIARGEGEHTHA